MDTGAAFTGGAGNDTFKATGKTLTALDSLDGAGGVNTLDVQDADAVMGTTLPAGVVLKNIQKMVVNTAGALGNVTAAATAPAKGVNTITFSGTPAVADTYTVTINGVNYSTAGAAGTSPADEAAVVAAVINAQLGAGTATVFGNTVQYVGSAAGAVMPTISVTPLAGTGNGAASAPVVTLAPSVGTAATTAAVFDVTGVAGLADFTGSAAGAVNVKAAATTDVTLTNTAASAAVAVDGGKVVNVTNGAGAVTIGGAALTAATVTGGTTVAVNDNNASAVSQKTLTSVTINKIGGNATLTGDALTSVTLGGANAAAQTVTVNNTTAAHTLSINANGTGYDSAAIPVAKTVTVADSVATTAAFNTTAKSNLALNGASVTKVTAAGAGDLALDLASAANVAAFDGAAATGGLTLAGITNKALDIKTGAGKDSVTITQAMVAGTNINLGAGDDKLLATSTGSIANSTATATTVIDGGDGVDTLALALVGSANIAVFKNFEIFDTVAMSTGNTLDLDILASTNTVNGIVGSGAFTNNGTVTLTNLGAGVNYSQNGAFDSTNDILSLTQKVAGALTVTLNSDSNSTTVQNDTGLVALAGNATSLKAVFDVDSGFVQTSVTTNDQILALTGTKATTLEVVSGGTNATNVLNYTGGVSAIATADLLTGVTITGSQALSFGYAASGGGSATAIATIDASGMTGGGLTVGTIALKDGGTIKLGAGTDNVLVAKSSIAATPANVESLQNYSKSTSATDAAAIKLADKLSFDYALTDAADAVAVISTAATGTGYAVSAKGIVTFTGAGPTTLDAAMLLANTAAGGTNGNAVAFQYINDTYVFVEGGGSAVTLATDVVIKLTGVTGVASLNEVGTTDVLFLA